MKLISKSPFFHKRVFPTIWFGFLALFWAFAVSNAIRGPARDGMIPMLAIPLGMAGFGYVLMKLLVFDLVDEVWDADRELIVRNKGREIHVPLTEIVNVNYSGATNPPRITLMLRDPGELGSEIAFMIPNRLWPFSAPPLAKELILRIDAARHGNRNPP